MLLNEAATIWLETFVTNIDQSPLLLAQSVDNRYRSNVVCLSRKLSNTCPRFSAFGDWRWDDCRLIELVLISQCIIVWWPIKVLVTGDPHWRLKVQTKRTSWSNQLLHSISDGPLPPHDVQQSVAIGRRSDGHDGRCRLRSWSVFQRDNRSGHQQHYFSTDIGPNLSFRLQFP